MPARILFFASVLLSALWLAAPLAAQVKGEAELRRLFSETEWNLESTCGIANYFETWSGVGIFSAGGDFVADTECRHPLDPIWPTYRGKWLIKDGRLCFDDVVSKGTMSLRGFKTGYCFDVVVENKRLLLLAINGDRNWYITPKKHAEYQSLDDVIRALKHLK